MLRIVKTENGLVRGLPAADPRITAFKGIPFAAPPVGENRWRAPQPCKNWEGTLDAYQFAPISMQDTPGVGTDIYCREWHVDPEIPMGEDCLYLNVWTNAKSNEDNLPVLIWFFGGGFQWGYTAEMEFDGERIARRGVVVVTVNYRLNLFGFLAHPEITKEQPDAPSNFGLLDQQAGIKWVIRNIKEFGGDPKNITIAGQSAGGGSVMSQLTAPSNKGLFQRAVVMSGIIRSPYGNGPIAAPTSLHDAEQQGKEFLEFAGASTLAEARKLDASYLLQKYNEYAATHMRMFTIQDDKFCVGDPIQLYAENKHIGVPIMAGNTTDEFLSFIPAANEQELKEKAAAIFGSRAEEFLAFPEASKRYGEHGYAPVSGIECKIKDLFLQNRKNGNQEDCYYYRFDGDIPGWDNPGTFHSVELWFFFETLAKCWRPFEGRHYDLSRYMCNYITNFIKTGNPNGPDANGTPMPEWKSYTKEHPAEMTFRTDGLVTGDREETPFMSFLIEQIHNR
ncbi:MAG: carboxylesterase family protein [Lachnospiraceae bacterium]|nr:carboxylesterase family protein [Lachnospiraceae bacterium]